MDVRAHAVASATPARSQPLAASQPITSAVILAAGAGSRLRNGNGQAPPKPLTPVLGRTLIERTIRTFRAGGVSEVTVVVGHDHERIERELDDIAERLEMRITAVLNHRWELGNGTSVLAAAEHVSGAFYLSMSDHLFTSGFLARLAASDRGNPLSLVVDFDWQRVLDLDDATKVRLDGERIVGIGKELTAFDAVDTGVFLCRAELFSAVRRAQVAGDFSLSGGVRVLAREGQAIAVSSDGLFWQDIDTPADLALAERRLRAHRARQQSDGTLHPSAFDRPRL